MPQKQDKNHYEWNGRIVEIPIVKDFICKQCNKHVAEHHKDIEKLDHFGEPYAYILCNKLRVRLS